MILALPLPALVLPYRFCILIDLFVRFDLFAESDDEVRLSSGDFSDITIDSA